MTNPNWKSIADVASTLTDLKKLPIQRQAFLLLARLSAMGQPRDGFNKWNLGLRPGELAIGYSPQEHAGVVAHLLGRPWQELVNQAHLFEGAEGFYHISEEGRTALASEDLAKISRDAHGAIRLLHPDLKGAERGFREGRFEDAVRDAFRIYENRLNAIRDKSSDPALIGKTGVPLAFAFVKSSSVFRFPFPGLAPANPRALEAFKDALSNLLAGALGFVRNAYDHEPYNLPTLDERSTLELLYFASYLLRLIDPSTQ
jgi:hypothetical protein